MSHLFSFLSTPPTEAIIDGVHKLEPGHLLTATPGRAPIVERYWDLKFEPDLSRSRRLFRRSRGRTSGRIGSPAYGERRPSGSVSQRRNRFQRDRRHGGQADHLAAEDFLHRLQRGRLRRDGTRTGGRHAIRDGPSRIDARAGRPGRIGESRVAPGRALRRLVRHSHLHGFQTGGRKA